MSREITNTWSGGGVDDQGIQDQPGFISGTNFLLPWDVTVKTEAKDKWPTIAETSGKKIHSLKSKKGGRGI